MIALIRFAFQGGIPPSCRTWFLGGRLIALRKEGDNPSHRRLRPIAIGSVLGRVVSKCAAAGSAVRFSTLFQPPTAQSCSSRPRPREKWQIFPRCCSMIFEGLPNAPSTAHGARSAAATELRRSCADQLRRAHSARRVSTRRAE